MRMLNDVYHPCLHGSSMQLMSSTSPVCVKVFMSVLENLKGGTYEIKEGCGSVEPEEGCKFPHPVERKKTDHHWRGL